MKILAVDDDEIILELLKETVACSGFDDVTIASSGQEALQVIKMSPVPFDCFLLDIQMPHMDGVELCSRIRAIHAYKKSPILMITAMSDKQYVDRAFAAGASDYVTKPFDVLELGTRVTIASRLVDELKQAERAEFENVTLKERLEHRTRHEVSDPLPIEDVDGFLDYTAFENYLLLQSRQGHFTSGLIALEIENIGEIYTRTPAEDFYYLLTDIGEAISDTFRGKFDFLSYRGDGIYVCAFNRGRSPFSEETASDLRLAIAELYLIYGSGEPMNVTINIGEQVAPGIFSSPGSLKNLFKAIDNLHHTQTTQKIDVATLLKPRRKQMPWRSKILKNVGRAS